MPICNPLQPLLNLINNLVSEKHLTSKMRSCTQAVRAAVITKSNPMLGLDSEAFRIQHMQCQTCEKAAVNVVQDMILHNRIMLVSRILQLLKMLYNIWNDDCKLDKARVANTL